MDNKRAVRTIDDKDVSVWIRPDGYYVMVSFNLEHTFVLGFDDARLLGDALLLAAEKAGAAMPRE